MFEPCFVLSLRMHAHMEMFSLSRFFLDTNKPTTTSLVLMHHHPQNGKKNILALYVIHARANNHNNEALLRFLCLFFLRSSKIRDKEGGETHKILDASTLCIICKLLFFVYFNEQKEVLFLMLVNC